MYIHSCVQYVGPCPLAPHRYESPTQRTPAEGMQCHPAKHPAERQRSTQRPVRVRSYPLVN